MFGMSMLMMPIQTAGLNQLPNRLNAHGTAISNTIRQVAGAVGTALLVTIMTNRATTHGKELVTSGAAQGWTKEQIATHASIEGINDAYLVIIGIGIIGLLLAFFIKRVAQAEDSSAKDPLKKATVQET
ncbi:Multidrug export protein EmrB [compost metagenome]